MLNLTYIFFVIIIKLKVAFLFGFLSYLKVSHIEIVLIPTYQLITSFHLLISLSI